MIKETVYMAIDYEIMNIYILDVYNKLIKLVNLNEGLNYKRIKRP